MLFLFNVTAWTNLTFVCASVYLQPNWTNDPNQAAQSIKFWQQNNGDGRYSDLAKGAGGTYRYIAGQNGLGSGVPYITNVALIRSPSYALNKPPSGWKSITSNINDGRGGDFLYVIWQ